MFCHINKCAHTYSQIITLKRKKKMNYLILAETEFFALINEAGNGCLETAYGGFIKAVISLCHENNDRNSTAVVLAYTENELQHHHTLYSATAGCQRSLYVRKALSFVRKMQKHLAAGHAQVSPLNPIQISHTPKVATTATTTALQWTGNTLDLVELIYGLSEMGCIDNGETPLKVLAPALYEFFGLDTKECYRYYSAIKLRKNPSRTYFIDKMQKKLNEKIRRDEELERMRR